MDFDFRSAPTALSSALSTPEILDSVVQDCQVNVKGESDRVMTPTTIISSPGSGTIFQPKGLRDVFFSAVDSCFRQPSRQIIEHIPHQSMGLIFVFPHSHVAPEGWRCLLDQRNPRVALCPVD